MPVLQKYMVILAGLGAGYLVVSNPAGVYRAAQSFNKITAGAITGITTGGKRGG